MPATTETIDLSEVKAELAKLTPEEIKKSLLELRVRQKVQQKKQQEKGSQKNYQAKQLAKRKLMKETAIALGIWDEINQEADILAEKEYAKITDVA